MDTQTTACAERLQALVEGRLDAWHGLPANCVKQDAEAGMGPSETGPDGAARLDGILTAFRRYPGSAAAPHGVQVWFRDDVIYGVEIMSPALPQPFTTLIGEPEVKERSRIGAVHTQWIYASKGLVLHVQNVTNAVVRMYGFPPCTIEAFRQLPWGRVEVRRELRPDR
jgi:hypothetical protein